MKPRIFAFFHAPLVLGQTRRQHAAEDSLP
jgi:hypothetical protein